MVFSEVKQNLLDVPQDWYIAHCISADCALGAGVAKQIDQAFDMRHKLRLYMPDGIKIFEGMGPFAAILDRVINLVTKKNYWDKPSLQDLEQALINMREKTEVLHIRRVAMPRIGCGLDRLNWKDVRRVIMDVFKGADIDIMICSL